MTATTPIYGLSYPEGSDLISTAPDSFKAMADTFEQALDQVDRRSTPTGVKPVIATTLATLAQTVGVTGQTGYVTADGDNNGAYVWSGSAWRKLALLTDISDRYEAGTESVKLSALGAASINFAKNHTTAPKAVVVTRVRVTSGDTEDRARLFHPIVWSFGPQSFQARFYRIDTNGWLNDWNVSFSWIAVW